MKTEQKWKRVDGADGNIILVKPEHVVYIEEHGDNCNVWLSNHTYFEMKNNIDSALKDLGIFKEGKTEQKWARVKDINENTLLINADYVVAIAESGDYSKISLSSKDIIEVKENLNDALMKLQVLEESIKG